MAEIHKTTVETSTEKEAQKPVEGIVSPSPSSTHSKNESEESPENDLALTKTLSRIDTADYPHGLRLVIILISISLSIFLVALDLTIIATAIPSITSQFHSLDDVGWYGSAFFLTVAAFQSTWGKAYKYFPLKPTFALSVVIFEVGSLICAVAKSSTTLIVGRAIAGVGAAGLSSGSYVSHHTTNVLLETNTD